MEEDGTKPPEPELRFGTPTQQEVERSRNLKLIVTLLIGPFLVLMILGYHDAAAGVLMCSIGAIIYFVGASFRQQTPWENDEDDEVIELGLKEQRPTAKPTSLVSVVKTNFRRR